MNWLAHVFLSEADIEFRLGNLLADLVRRRERDTMSAMFMRGVRQHQSIDAFTDTHPVVRRSCSRLGGTYSHATGILIDVFYDHFLAVDWEQYCDHSLDEFTGRLYGDVRAHRIDLPAEARDALERIMADDLLGSYRGIDGIESALRKLSARLTARVGRDFALDASVKELRENYGELRGDFAEFFPQLRSHVA